MIPILSRVACMTSQTAAHRCAASALLLAGAILFTGACSQPKHSAQNLPDSQSRFWANLSSLCGNAYAGRITEDSTASPDFEGRPLIVHFIRCEDGRILAPFHVGEDRSRTWVLTQTTHGLRLKHDHRHEDGSEDELTWYGGDTRAGGTPNHQEFHADAHTASLIPAAATNVWTMEVHSGRMFAYALRREGTDRRFRAEFDLSRPITPPPPPWGYTHD